MRRLARWFGSAIAVSAVTGCAHRATHPVRPTRQAIKLAAVSGLTTPVHDSEVQATVVPPAGWKSDPLKSSDSHKHRVWVSPTGNTAYGVIYFTLQLPIGADLTLWGFMNSMKKSEGDSVLISKQTDDALPGIRFVAEGGQYRIRANLVMGSYEGWAIYAGSLRSRPIDWAELRLAIRSREQTRVDQ